MKKVLGAIRRADQQFHMIAPGDHVMVGLSGGKDSLLLVQALGLYRRFANNPFTLCAGVIDLGFTGFNTDTLQRYCDAHEVPLHIRRTRIGPVVFDTRQERNPCALCAKMRRATLVELALQRGCRKLALGHHRDDVLETLLLSMLYESRIRTFAPVTYLDRKSITQIRPLIYLDEKHILNVSRRLALPVGKNPCPAAGNTKREEIKALMRHLRTLKGDVDDCMIAALRNTHTYGLWDKIAREPDTP